MECCFAVYLYLDGDLYYYFACGFVGAFCTGGVLCGGDGIDNSIVLGSVYCYLLGFLAKR